MISYLLKSILIRWNILNVRGGFLLIICLLLDKCSSVHQTFRAKHRYNPLRPLGRGQKFISFIASNHYGQFQTSNNNFLLSTHDGGEYDFSRIIKDFDEGGYVVNKPINITDKYVYEEVASLIRSGVPESDVKHLFFDPKIDIKELKGATIPDLQAFISSPEDSNVKLLGEDDPRNPIGKELELGEYTDVDAICQTLITSLREYEKSSELIPIKKECRGLSRYRAELDILTDYYVPNDKGLPDVLYEWNRRYVNGYAILDPSERDAYDDLWNKKLTDLILYYTNRFKLILTKRISSSDENEFVDDDNPSDTRPKIRVGSKILKLKPWTDYLSPRILKFIATQENSKLSFRGRQSKPFDEIKAELVRAYMSQTENHSFKRRYDIENERLRREYVDFCYNHNHTLRKGRAHLPLMPFWLWYDFWRGRETMVQDTLYNILNDILLADPYIDMEKTISGTLENMMKPRITGSKRDARYLLQAYESIDTKKIDELLGLAKSIREEGDGRVAEDDGAEISTDENEIPRPLAYYFKDVLSHDKFEEAYLKFNMEKFGTPDYNLQLGSLVKGTVYHVDKYKVLVDIHARLLGTLTPSNYFGRLEDVPLAGDQLMFEVVELWPDKIILSLANIKKLHRYKTIFNKRAMNEIFYVRVIQRYNRGVLVQYSEDLKETESTADINPDNMNDIAWIPLSELSPEYYNPLEITDRSLLGKCVPVLYDHYNENNHIPVLSNLRAIRRMQLMHIKVNDIVKGRIIDYKKNHILIKVGELHGLLPVLNMSRETYQRHLRGYESEVGAIVKSINVSKEFIELTTKLLSEVTHSRLSQVNSFLRLYRSEPDNVSLYNNSKHCKDAVITKENLKRMKQRELNYSSIEIMNREEHDNIGELRTAINQNVSDDDGEVYKDYIKWNLTSEDYLKEDPSLSYEYNKKLWQIFENDAWNTLPFDEQKIINDGKVRNDEIVYYKFNGTNYKVDLVENLRHNLDALETHSLRYKANY